MSGKSSKYTKSLQVRGYNRAKSFQCENGNELITTLEDYMKSSNVRVNIKCKCGNEFDVMKSAAIVQRMCPKCSVEKRALSRRSSSDEILNALERLSIYDSNKYTWVSGKHINSKSRITISDNNGYLYSSRTTALLTSEYFVGFPFHAKNPFTLDNIRMWMKTNTPNYELLSTDYITIKDYLTFRCPEGHIFKMNFDNFKNGQRCPECKLSKGAREVLYSLKNNNLKYIIEYRFDDCRGKRNSLPFDFAIFDDEYKNIKWLCEFDGELHYEESRFSSDVNKNKKKLEERKRYDKIKTDYCIKHSIPLLRIPYWERDNRNVENVIDKFLSSISQSKSA